MNAAFIIEAASGPKRWQNLVIYVIKSSVVNDAAFS